MKRVLLLVLLSGCATTQELQEHKELENAMFGRMLGRVKALEEDKRQDDAWVKQVQLETKLEELREELNRVEYIISLDKDETKCPK